MVFILLVFLLGITFLEYKYVKKYLLHPVVVYVGVFCLSLFVSCANYYRWGDISFTTFFVILSSCVAFIFGGQIARYNFTFSRKNVLKQENVNRINDINIVPYKTIFVIFFMISVTILNYKDILNLAGSGVSGLLAVISSARLATYKGEAVIEHSGLVQQGLYMCKVMAYIYIYVIFYKKILLKSKIKLIEIVPVVLYFIQALLTTGRTELIYVIYAILVMGYFITMKKAGWKIKSDSKYIKMLILGMGIFIIIFLIISNARKGGQVNIINTLSIYMGSSINALDAYINEFGINQCANFWGEETQSLFYSVMRKVGADSRSSIAVLTPVYLGEENSLTNIYTSIRRYLHDYGYFGMIIINVGIGYIYSKFFDYIRKKSDMGMKIVMYALLTYPLIEMSIEERFFSHFVSARTVYCIIYCAIFYVLLLKQSKTVINT